jgi:serine/threonine protein kinase
MISACQHCDQRVSVEMDGHGGLFRCPQCRSLNVLFERDTDGAIQFGDFIVMQEVGQGANAIVCKAQNQTTGETIALKLFYSETTVDSLSKREFLRENEFSKELEHENIVKTISGGECDGVLYLELEFINGLNLAEYLDEYGRMEISQALGVGEQVCQALDFVWSNHLVIHRDVKPQNVMVDAEGNVKVCDFGMVTAHEQAMVDINAVEGTPYYLSPECVTDGSYQDNRSDIYSLGATLFHIIAGEPPFNYDTLESVIYARVREEPQDIRDFVPEASEDLALLLKTMMARDPDDRYVTAYECLEDVTRIRRGEKPNLVDKNRLKVNQ